MRVQRLYRLVAAAALAAAAVVVLAPAAGAHPRLVSADPKPSTVAPSPVNQVTVHFDESVQWQYSTIGIEDTKGHNVMAGKAQLASREAVLPLQPGTTGALRVSWKLVGVDAHPVTGAYVFGIGAAAGAGATDIDSAIRRMAGSLGEGRVGSASLNWAIRGGRSVEIAVLYVVLGLLLLRLLVLDKVPAPAAPRPGPGAATVASIAAVEPDRGYRIMRTLGIVAAVAMPLLFTLYVARLDSAVGHVPLGNVLFSSMAEEWAMKTVLWAGI